MRCSARCLSRLRIPRQATFGSTSVDPVFQSSSGQRAAVAWDQGHRRSEARAPDPVPVRKDRKSDSWRVGRVATQLPVMVKRSRPSSLSCPSRLPVTPVSRSLDCWSASGQEPARDSNRRCWKRAPPGPLRPLLRPRDDLQGMRPPGRQHLPADHSPGEHPAHRFMPTSVAAERRYISR